ncbi:MAG: T9SS type A sorting domain-containing protein [Chitinophagales bacterium]|nr:T9SS type A sorting domain-containing protein [Chitinophagales bacterium]
MLKYTAIVTTLLWVSFATGQNEVDYRLSALLTKGKVQLNITIKAGSTCNGIFIERSVDSLYYNEVGDIAGVCGSSDADVPYTFIDVAPVPNSVNYYRVRFGDYFYSAPVSVLNVVLSNQYKVVPNPAVQNAVIYFDNEDKETFELNVSDSNGRLVLQLTDIKDNKVSVNTGSFTAGNYYFLLRSKDGHITNGTFTVAQ